MITWIGYTGGIGTQWAYITDSVCESLYVCERETLAITLLNGTSTPCEEGNVTEQGEVRQLLQ